MASFNNTTETSPGVAEELGTQNTAESVIVFCLLNILNGLFGTVLNLVISYLMATQPAWRHKPSSKLYWSMSVADLLTCSALEIVLIYRSVRYSQSQPQSFPLYITRVASIIPGLSSVFHFFFMSLDRYICITKSLRYLLIVSGERVLVCILICWLLPCLATLVLIFYGSKTTKLILSGFSISVLCGTLVLQVKILLIARKHERQIAEVHQRYGQTVDKNSNNWVRRNKAAKTLGVLLGTHLVCWLPMLLTVPHLEMPDDWGIFKWLQFLICFNSAINPCLYILMTREFRVALTERLTAWGLNSSTSPTQSSSG